MTGAKEILWREPISQVNLWEKEGMDLDQECQQGLVENFCLEEDQKGEEDFLPNFEEWSSLKV